MTQEQKAKAYDEAIERANSLLSSNELGNVWIYKVLPELKESEDEKIRKTLIHIVKGACSKYGIKYQGKEIGEEKLLSWLEKQGEQNDILEDALLDSNEDGLIAETIIYKNETQGEQKIADVEEVNFFDDFRKTDSEVEPKFI